MRLVLTSLTLLSVLSNLDERLSTVSDDLDPVSIGIVDKGNVLSSVSSSNQVNLLTLILPSSGLFLNLTPSSSNLLTAASRLSTATQICPKPFPTSSFPEAYPLKLSSFSDHQLWPGRLARVNGPVPQLWHSSKTPSLLARRLDLSSLDMESISCPWNPRGKARK